MPDFNLSLRERVGQLFMVGFQGKEIPGEVEKFISSSNIGFVILFARNIESADQIVNLTNHIHSLGHISPFIYTDQEGGTVVQFKELAATVISPMGIAATGNPKNARIAGRIIGEEMDACGIDGILAPVLDVNFEEDNPIIGIRSFSDEPEIVINFAREFYSGLKEMGIAGCGKHYPGHGGTLEDSHLKIPQVDINKDDFFHFCFKPFEVFAGLKIDAIMSSHIRYPTFSDQIATFSPVLIDDLLRKKCRYNGLVMSDCMEMNAVKDNFSPEEIITNSINSGIDVITVSHHLDFQKELFNILCFKVQSGFISETKLDKSVERILTLKKKINLLKARKIRNKKEAGEKLRSHFEIEKKMADNSVTVLKNEKGILPLNPEKKVLILEWQKVKASMSFEDAEDISMLGETAKKYFKKMEVLVLNLTRSLPRNLGDKLRGFPNIIAGLYSRQPEVEQRQSVALKKLLQLRDDIIVVSLGNPYDIRNFPDVNTCIVTYGFRNIQLEALFDILVGNKKPSGTLPVKITHHFPRGFGIKF